MFGTGSRESTSQSPQQRQPSVDDGRQGSPRELRHDVNLADDVMVGNHQQPHLERHTPRTGSKTGSNTGSLNIGDPISCLALPHDMWGVSLLLIVKDLPDICEGCSTALQKFRFFYSAVTCTFNIVIQIAILFWVRLYVVLPAIVGIQEEYLNFHKVVFDTSGAVMQDAWAVFEGKDRLCEAVIGNQHFLCVLLFFWSARMLVEFKEVTQLMRDLNGLPPLGKDKKVSDMVRETVSDNEEIGAERRQMNHIVALNGPARFACFFGVILPRICIALFLWYMGYQWLAATTHFKDLVLNALALEFVVKIDEIFYEAFFPKKFRSIIDNTTVDSTKSEKTHELEERQMLKEFGVNMCLFLFCVAAVQLYYFCIQTVLPGYKFDIHDLCQHYWKKSGVLRCRAFESGCFPFGEDPDQNG